MTPDTDPTPTTTDATTGREPSDVPKWCADAAIQIIKYCGGNELLPPNDIVPVASIIADFAAQPFAESAIAPFRNVPPAPAARDLVGRLVERVMNLHDGGDAGVAERMRKADAGLDPENMEQWLAYKIGHRDARHAAASLITEFFSTGEGAMLVPDYPDADSTDFAHPAWWRGHDNGVFGACMRVNEALDGKPLVGVCQQPLQGVRERVAAALARVGELEREVLGLRSSAGVLIDANNRLEWQKGDAAQRVATLTARLADAERRERAKDEALRAARNLLDVLHGHFETSERVDRGSVPAGYILACKMARDQIDAAFDDSTSSSSDKAIPPGPHAGPKGKWPFVA